MPISTLQGARQAVLARLVERMQTLGLTAEAYTLERCDGYAALSAGHGPAGEPGNAAVHCVEVLLGASPGKTGYSTYAMAQLPFLRYPNLALTCLVSLRDRDRQPDPAPARFSVAIDSKFSTLFLPAAFSAFNTLDPTGRRRSLLVGSYSSQMLATDFVHASLYSYKLLRRYKRDGQLALIAVDYHDPYSRLIARALQHFQGVVPDLHLRVRTATPSALRIPVRAADGGYHCLAHSSTALEDGFAVAFGYLDRHYAEQEGLPPEHR